MWKRLVLAACAVVLAAGCPLAVPVGSAVAEAGPVAAAPAAPSGSFTFDAAGDFGANTRTDAVLNAVPGSGADFFLAVGDLSYSEVTPESAWCNFVTSRVGPTYPFELVAGNHEDNGPDGQIANFAACLPDRIGNISGSYAKEYYFDYPPSSSPPLARVINISPNLTFPGESTYNYTVGSAHYTWLSNAIDSARTAGIPWVIVSMHENCIKAGSSACEIGTDLQNLLVNKKVDLVLQGHTHTYQRSKQLALGPNCPSVTNTAFDADCVVNDGSTNNYVKGAGMVLVISGTGGEGFGSVSTTDPDAKYFAKLMGNGANPSAGFTKFSVSATQLSAQYVAATGSFADSFTIANGAPPGDQAPTAIGASLSTAQDTNLPVTLQATDPDTASCAGFTFTVTQPAHGTVDTPGSPTCTSDTTNHISAATTYRPAPGFNGVDSFTFKVSDGTLSSNTATVSITVGTPPPGATFRSATAASNPTATTLTINVPANVAPNDVMVAGVGIRGAPSITAPAGWNLIRKDAAGTYTTQALYSRVVTGTEPASYTWSFSSSVPAAGGISDYIGVNTAAPVNVSAGMGTNSNTTTIVAPSVTTTVAAAQVVGFFSIGGANAITPPTGMTERGEASSTAGSNHVTWESSDFTQASAGSTGTKTASSTVAHPNVGALVALAPGSAPANQAPVASDASATTTAGTAVPVTLSATDAETCPLTFSVVTGPAHGSLSGFTDQGCASGPPKQDTVKTTYTPTDSTFTGTDSFTYRVSDGTANSNVATVTITVTAPGNQAPVASDASATTTAGTAVPVTLSATDAETCPLTFSVVTGPAHGSLSGFTDQGCASGPPKQDTVKTTYTPTDSTFTGTDSFTYRVSDGTANSNVATVTITVTPPSAGITFRSATSAANPTAPTLTINVPAGVRAGDVMVAGIGIRGAPSVATPAGWTFLRSDAAGTYTTQALFYRVVTATPEPASYTWSFSGSVPAAGGISAYQGVNTTTPVATSAGLGQNFDTLSIMAPSVTTTVAGSEVVGFFSIGGGNSITPPAGMTERGEASSTAGSNHVTWESSDFTQASPGATGTKTATASSSPHPNVGALVVLTPA